MTSVIDEFATASGIQTYLQRTPGFSAYAVKQLAGGYGNFVYRIYLQEPFAGRKALVLKYAPPYAAKREDFPMDQKRQLFEVQALRLASQLFTPNIPTFLSVPAVHMFDEEKHIVIMDDIGEDCRTLKDLLLQESLSRTISEQIGSALGEFISNVHTWHQRPDIDLTVFASNQVGKDISVFMTYARLESTLTGKNDIPALSDPLLGIPDAKMDTILKIAKKRERAIQAASSADPLTHGDLWPGNLILSVRRGEDGTIAGVEKLYVIDWELCKAGLPGLDLGQFCAEMHILSKFYPARGESAQTIIGSFLGAYRERRGTGGDIELARTVLSHVGAHSVVFTPRISSWTGRQKTREVVGNGVEMLVMSEEGSESYLRTTIVGHLLDA